MKTTHFFSTAAQIVLAHALSLLFLASAGQGPTADDPWTALPRYQFGQSREPLAAVEDQIRKCTSAERVAIERRLMEILQSPDTTKDSRRFICRWLGIVGSEESVAPLAALLTDPDLAHPARIALEALPFPSAGQALIDAIPKLKGNLLVGVVSSIGTKRVPAAVPALGKLLKDADPAIVGAALLALGQIGNEPADHALAAAQVAPSLARDRARARISAAGRLAETGKKSPAAAVYRQLLNQSGQAAEIRVAAFLGLAGTLPPKDAADLIVSALETSDPLLRPAAVKAFTQTESARDSVAAKLPAMQPTGQLLLLGILADAPEVAAREPLLAVAKKAQDPAARAAAVECLAVHGKAEDLPLIAQWAATSQDPVKTTARKALQRISGPGVDATLVRLIESADIGQRRAVMEALPSRRMDSALPTLRRLLRGKEPALAAEAARTIGSMGGTAELKDLVQVLTATPDAGLRSETQEAIQTICTRTEDKGASAGVLEGEFQKATAPATRKALLPLLVYTGGKTGLEQVLRGMADEDGEVRAVAFRTLVEWPEAAAGGPLLRFAQTNAETSQGILALRDGCLRLAEMEEASVSDRAAILRGVVQTARRPDEKKRALALMGQVPSLELLQFLRDLTAGTELRAEAVAATVQLARSLGAVYPRQCLAALEEIGKNADTPELRKAVEEGARAVRNAGQSPEGFILGWLVSGPFTAADTDGSGLFDVPFPPEKTSAEAEWRPYGAAPNGMVDLGKSMAGENRVAYLRTTLSSEQDQEALLELGSDDGIKVWLNEELVHANNATRGCAPGQDKVSVKLRKGDNALLLKITQGGGEWAAVTRLRNPAGKPLPTVTVGPAGK